MVNNGRLGQVGTSKKAQTNENENEKSARSKETFVAALTLNNLPSCR